MMINKTGKHAGMIAIAMVGAGVTYQVEAAVVTLNGQPLTTSVAPIQRGGRTLVPMRDIFQALGATVAWNGQTQGISATHGVTNIGLNIGNRNATVNGRNVYLDQPTILYKGNTMVPMRFVSEALGARVTWNGATEIAAITTGPGTGSGQEVASVRQISVPAGAVVKVTLDRELSSATAKSGDHFSSTVVSRNAGDSEFPVGSKIEGTVSDVQRQDGDTPGMLDLRFQSVVLPGGTRYPLEGLLTSLDEKSVDTSTPGRIMGKAGSDGGNNKLVVVGIGAGVGFVLGKLIKKNTSLTTILGAAAGYFIGKKGNKNNPSEAMLPTNMELGVRLGRAMTYADSNGYYTQRSTYYKM